MGRNLMKAPRPFKVAPVEKLTEEQIQAARKSRLKELMRQAYNAGFMPSIEWRHCEIMLLKIEPRQVESSIEYYQKLLASKQAA